MDRRQVSSPHRLIGLFIILSLASSTFAFEPNWTSYTSFRDVRRVRQINDTIYFVTSGGLLAVHDVAEPPTTFNNLSSLGTADLTDIIRDTDGQTWISAMGRLIKFNGATSQKYMFFDEESRPFRIHCIADDGDFLWLGTDKGLVLFSKTIDGGRIEDSYGLYGNLNPNPAVYDVLLRGDSILIATSAGVAIGDKSNRLLLKAPANWTTYGAISYPEMGTDTVRRVSIFEDNLYFGTVKGLLRLDRNPADTLVRTAVPDSARVNDLRVDNDTLFIYSDSGFAAIFGGSAFAINAGGMPLPVITGINLGSLRWVVAGEGELFYGNTSGMTLYETPGLLNYDCADVAIGTDGSIGVLFRIYNAVQILRPGAQSWETVRANFGDRGLRIVPGYRGEFWAGTYGEGLYRVSGQGNFRHYDTAGTTLQGISGRQDYIVTYGVDIGDGYLFASCYLAYGNEAVAIGQLGNDTTFARWTTIGFAEGINNAAVGELDHFADRVALGTESEGLFECYLGGDPFGGNTSCSRYTETDGFLISNTVRTVKYAPDSSLWVGTNFGVSHWDRGRDRFRDVALPAGFGPDITAMEFDTRGNLWLGAANGLARRDATTGDIEVFTSLGSGLVNDAVQSIYFDTLTSDVLIATRGGVSKLTATLAASPTRDVAVVRAFPNPFIISSSADRLNFNYAGTGTIRIFTLAGELVAEQPINQPWDGRNRDGTEVSSGVYLFVLNADDGSVGRGKFLLVRQ